MDSLRSSRLGASLLAVAVMAFTAGCSGGGSNPNSTPGTGGDFLVLQTSPANNGRLFLNEPIAFDFSNPVDLSTADLNSVSFTVLDLNGNPVAEQPQGTFEVVDTPGDSISGRRLQFSPRFPTNDTFDNGGFRPGRRYIVQLAAGSASTSITDMNQKPLRDPVTFQFDTADGTTPFELFRDTIAGGPTRTGFSVTTLDNGMTPLGFLSGAAVEVRVDFDQPLNPSTANVPTNIDPDPTVRAEQGIGRIFMRYATGTGGAQEVIPATVELARNALDGSTVVLRPIGVLPNNADVQVVVLPTLQDLSGESISSDDAIVVGTFETVAALEPQYDALVENFNASRNTIDFDAPILEPQAAIAGGRLTSTFSFDGQTSALDYTPSAAETTLNTNFTQIQPVGAEPINVAGGVFSFRNVTIPEGRTVRGSGPRPMVWLITENMTVNGTLTVSGGNGARVDTLNSANFPTGGGIGVCEGGNGGRGSPNALDRSLTGEAGFGPRQRPGGGGDPGQLFCTAGTGTGSGGGGGQYRQQLGDPEFMREDLATVFVPEAGVGRTITTVIEGGAAGPSAFSDSRADNNFFGQAVNVFGEAGEGLRIRGELLAPRGGTGGGGGGDNAPRCNLNDSQFFEDEKGGGGGAGGGVLIIQCLGTLRIGPQGKILSEGGGGGGGEEAGANTEGGGGGGGSGGMVIISAAGGIEIVRHALERADGLYVSPQKSGGTFVNNVDSSFAISADGGVSIQGSFQNQQISGKYNSDFDTADARARATGGFGGLGVVQLLTTPGDDSDGTGTALDDNITFFDDNGLELPAAAKIELLGWRGFPDADGVRVDDNGNPISVVSDGDIRPAPILLPITFGPTQAVRSRWIDLGAVRRELGTSGPGVVNTSMLPRPDFEFEGVNTAAGAENGFVSFESGTGDRDIPVVTSNAAILAVDTDASYQGQPAFSIRVASGDLAAVPENRYRNYRVELASATGARIDDFRILAHTTVTGTSESLIFLEPDAVFPTDATQMRVIAKFFEITTQGQLGLGPLVAGEPRSNVRIRFAFHVDPTSDTAARYPAEGLSGDVAGLLQQAAADNERPGFVMWEVLFDQRFRGTPGVSVPMPVQTLDSLVLPFRF